MPIHVESRYDQDLTIFTAVGETPFHEQMSVVMAFYEGAPTRHVIWDLSAITGPRITSAELRQIVDYIKKQGQKRQAGITAFVTVSQLDFGLARMAGTLTEIENTPWQVVPCQSLEAALALIERERSR